MSTFAKGLGLFWRTELRPLALIVMGFVLGCFALGLLFLAVLGHSGVSGCSAIRYTRLGGWCGCLADLR